MFLLVIKARNLMSWEDSLNVFHYIYSKDNEGKRRSIKKVMKIRDSGISKQAIGRGIDGQIIRYKRSH
jgi:hypothetical protein